MMRSWLAERWRHEPLSVVGTLSTLLGLCFGIVVWHSKGPECEQIRGAYVAALRLATNSKISFELSGLHQATLRRAFLGECGPIQGISSSTIRELVVRPAHGARAVTIDIEARTGSNVQELRLKAQDGEVQTCVDRGHGQNTHCCSGPTSFVFDGTQAILLLGDGVWVQSVSDRSGARVCWETTMLHELRLAAGQLWVSRLHADTGPVGQP